MNSQEIPRQRHLRRHPCAALHHRRRARRLAGRSGGRCAADDRHRSAHDGARRHGGDLCRGHPRTARLDRVRLRDDPAAGGHGFPALEREGGLTRRDLYGASMHRERTLDTLLGRGPVAVFEHSTLRDAADQMVTEHVGRLPLVSRDRPRLVVRIATRSDLLAAPAPRLRGDRHRTIRRAVGRVGTEGE